MEKKKKVKNTKIATARPSCGATTSTNHGNFDEAEVDPRRLRLLFVPKKNTNDKGHIVVIKVPLIFGENEMSFSLQFVTIILINGSYAKASGKGGTWRNSLSLLTGNCLNALNGVVVGPYASGPL